MIVYSFIFLLMAEVKRIVRLAKIDISGERKLRVALTKVKGVGFMFGNALLNVLGLNPDEKLGLLTDAQLKALSDAIEHPEKYNIPHWMYNRRKDVVTGEDKHLVGVEIGLQLREDIKRMQGVKSYKGYRHGAGLKVRGQKTKSHPRKGRALGVTRKKLSPAAAAKEGAKK